MSLWAELRRRNVLRMAGLYLVVAWLVVQVAGTVLPMFGAPAWLPRSIVVLLAIGFVPALVFSWIYEFTPEGLKRDGEVTASQSTASATGRRMDRLIWAGLVAVIAIMAADRFWPRAAEKGGSEYSSGTQRAAGSESGRPELYSDPPSSSTAQKSIAVLAFADLSEGADNAYFADGISEELLNVLAKVPALKVAARTSAFHFKGKDTPVPEIARQLGVAYVVEGSVRRAGDRVRITAQLISANDGFHVWSESYDRELKDVFALQDEIAGIIAGKLQLTLGSSGRAAKVVNPEAYGLVLQGRHYWGLRTDEGFDRAERAYTRALELDPDFAQAHAALAELWAIRGWYRLLESKPGAPRDFERARAEARRALELDPALAEPHGALGSALFMEFHFAEAAAAYERALELNPNYAMAYNWFGHLRSARGDPRAGVDTLARARDLDPLSAIALNTYATLLYDVGRFDEALAAARQAQDLRAEPFVPDYAREAVVLLALGRVDEAVEAARVVVKERERSPRWWSDPDAVYVLEQAGLHDEARAHAQWSLAHWPEGSYQQGMVLASLGRHDEAWAALEALPPTPARMVYYEPRWDAVRDGPEFAALMAKLGLTKEYALARENIVRVRPKVAESRGGGKSP